MVYMKGITTPHNTTPKPYTKNKAMTALLGVLMVLPNIANAHQKNTQEEIGHVLALKNKLSVDEYSAENMFDIEERMHKKNLDLSKKIPPRLKDIYKKFLKVHSKQDIKNIQFD